MSDSATVIQTTRRYVDIVTFAGEEKRVIVASKFSHVTVGDTVQVDTAKDDWIIIGVDEPRNELLRSYQGNNKRVVANLDHLFIMAAPLPLFNYSFIDRVITVATLQEIPFSIVINKSDVDMQESRSLIDVYQNLGYPLIFTAALLDQGLAPIQELCRTFSFKLVAVTGVSGVGKSTLVNKIIPDASRNTQQVSQKTGQGKQTTSTARAFRLKREQNGDLLVVDLPGIQFFGIDHLEASNVQYGFPELLKFRSSCQYRDCRHIDEPGCAVLQALHHGAVAETRYGAYRGMLREIEQAKRY